MKPLTAYGPPLDGNAIVWCDGAFTTPYGKTAHGLVRFTHRYKVLSVIDAPHAGRDAAELLDGTPRGIPVVATFSAALADAAARDLPVTHLVIGLAPDGGRLPEAGRIVVKEALRLGISVDSGMHDFLSEDEELVALAATSGATIRDVRKPPHRKTLHHFSGRIEEVRSLKIAVLGTDSAVGKRTTAWLLVHGLQARGRAASMIGTGQTGWLQGAKYSLVLDSLVNDFVAGELEHAAVSAWDAERPDVIVIEGQGSLMNPAYPGGFEILAACRPDVVIMQHAPSRAEYDGFPGHSVHPIEQQIQVLTLLSGKPVIAITVNHEGLDGRAAINDACQNLLRRTGLPTVDPLIHGVGPLLDLIERHLKEHA